MSNYFPNSGEAGWKHTPAPGMAGRLLALLNARETLSVGDAAEAMDANRNTLKDKFTELVDKGYAELRGKGRGAHYRPLKK